MRSKRYAIYKHLDKKGFVLYIGLTTNMPTRQSQHRSKAKHKDHIHTIEVAYVPNKTSMVLYEQYYINKYNPEYNTKDKRGDAVDGLKGLQELSFNHYWKASPKTKNTQEHAKYQSIDFKVLLEELDNLLSNLVLYTKYPVKGIYTAGKVYLHTGLLSLEEVSTLTKSLPPTIMNCGTSSNFFTFYVSDIINQCKISYKYDLTSFFNKYLQKAEKNNNIAYFLSPASILPKDVTCLNNGKVIRSNASCPALKNIFMSFSHTYNHLVEKRI